MCNRARRDGEPETFHTKFGANWATPRPMDNRFNPKELAPLSRAYVVRQSDRGVGIDIMSWDVLGGQAKWPMTNVRQLGPSALATSRREAGEPLPHPADRVLRVDDRVVSGCRRDRHLQHRHQSTVPHRRNMAPRGGRCSVSRA
jgi:hypothetical protein